MGPVPWRPLAALVKLRILNLGGNRLTVKGGLPCCWVTGSTLVRSPPPHLSPSPFPSLFSVCVCVRVCFPVKMVAYGRMRVERYLTTLTARILVRVCVCASSFSFFLLFHFEKIIIIKGHIPEQLTRIRSLRELDLSRNQFTGEIPGMFSRWATLENLDLSSNRLGGKVPVGTLQVCPAILFLISVPYVLLLLLFESARSP